MANRIADDPRIDPRIKAVFGGLPDPPPGREVASREDLLAEQETEAAKAAALAQDAFLAMLDSEDVAPSRGLTTSTHVFTSAPDGTESEFNLSGPRATRLQPACTTSTAAACRPCPASTACTRRGVGSSPPRASRSRWSISGTAFARPQRRRSSPFRRA